MKIFATVFAAVLVHAATICSIHEEHFATLKLSPNATTDHIKARCAQLRMKLHPDPHNELADAAQYHKVTEACNALKNIHGLVPLPPQNDEKNHIDPQPASTTDNRTPGQPPIPQNHEKTFSVQNNFNSLVYDLPLRRSSLLYTFYDGPCERKSWLSLTGLGLGKSFTRENNTAHTTFGGVVGTWRDFADRFWVELKTAILSQNGSHAKGTEDTKEKKDTNRFGIDDVVLTFGYDPITVASKYVSAYAFVGIPTHRKRVFDGDLTTLVGTGTVNIGGGFDAETEFFATDDYNLSFFTSTRVMYRLPVKMTKSAHSEKPAGEDVDFANLTTDKKTTEDHVMFHAGGRADILIGGKFTFGSHGFEIGYDPTIPFSFNLENCPDDLKLEGKTLHTVYLAYSYETYTSGGSPLFITAGLSRGMGRENDFRSLGGWLTVGVGL
jgi:hypothetical protein